MPEGGCHEKTEWVTGYVTDECPVMWINEYAVVFEAYNFMEKGFLPYRGGWAEQPAILMQYVDIVGEVVANNERKRMEDQCRNLK